ncbi:MAG: lysophospholipid acyltransferase family protein [Schaedlerella sp.]|nr:lysophospholipid acyltransferase family protein [Schaedlerella sp.]
MLRILLMVLRNFWRVPGAWFKLCHYAKHTDKYPELEKYQHIQYILKRAVKSGNIDLQIHGKENIPKESGFLIYANHQGLFDILAIVATFDQPLAAVLKKELAEVPFLKQIKDCTKSFPMDREDVRQSMTVIMNVIKEIKKGRNYLIFPEGTRSKKGNEMLEFHAGSFKCATKTGCPIQPVALIDSYKVLDVKGCAPAVVQIHYLKPIEFEEYKGMNTSEVAALVKTRIQEAIDKYSK